MRLSDCPVGGYAADGEPLWAYNSGFSISHVFADERSAWYDRNVRCLIDVAWLRTRIAASSAAITTSDLAGACRVEEISRTLKGPLKIFDSPVPLLGPGRSTVVAEETVWDPSA
jgi:hypothetical protein